MSVAVPHAFAEGVVDTSKINKELITTANDKKYTIATVVKVDGIAWFDRGDGVDQFKVHIPATMSDGRSEPGGCRGTGPDR